MKNKKGYFFTLDAMFALIILLAVIILIPFSYISSVPVQSKTSFLQEDMLKVLSTLKTTDINNLDIDEITREALGDVGKAELLDDKDTLVDTMGKIWAYGNTTAAQNIAEDFFGNVFSERDNIGLFFVRTSDTFDTIYTKSRKAYTDSRDLVTSKKFMSGIAFNETVKGYSARAYLYKTEKTKYIYFGGYVGDGNITQEFLLPENVSVVSMTLEVAVLGSNFNLYTNNNLFGSNISNSSSPFDPITLTFDNSTNNMSKFVSGVNKINLTSTTSNKLYIAGGFIKLIYRTSSIEYFGPEQKFFPFINGTMNLYDSFYIPGNLTNMDLFLSYQQSTNSTPFIKIGNVTIWTDSRTDKTGINSIYLTNEEISGNLSLAGITYSDLSKETIPIRIGLQEMQAGSGSGNANVVLITDVSGSMGDINVNCNVSWGATTDQHHGGSWSASGVGNDQTMGNSQKACISKIFNFVGSNNNVTFWRRVRTETGDNLSFYINNVSKINISGNYGTWARLNFTAGSGINELKWCYEKDSSQTQYDDRVYIDDINISNSSVTIYTDNFESGLSEWTYKNASGKCMKLDIAQQVDDIFVDTVLNASGNLVGLTSYSSSPGVRWWINLTTNLTALKSQISSYSPQSATCISCGVVNATNILLQGDTNKFRGMLVMTDGLANTMINGTWTSDGYRYLAGIEATNKSCAARNSSNNVTIFSVGFGNDADLEQVKRIACWNCTTCPDAGRVAPVPDNSSCWIQNVTLPNGTVTTCLNSRWATSNDYEELRRIYQQFGEMFISLSYSNQTINISGGNVSSNLLDGYVNLTYDLDPSDLGFDEMEEMLTYETPGFLNGQTNFSLFRGSPFEIVVASYSGSVWTRLVNVTNLNGNYTAYNLDKWGETYMQLGDPFRINIPLEDINSNDTNYVGLRLGNNNSEYILPTSSSKVIYSILLPPTFSYSSPVGKREGCIWTIQSEDQGGNPGNNFTFNIPSTYNGSNICSYTAATGANIEDNQDAYELAVLNLLQDSLDLDNDNMTEVNIGADLSINVVLVQGIPFMHYTMARAMSWR